MMLKPKSVEVLVYHEYTAADGEGTTLDASQSVDGELSVVALSVCVYSEPEFEGETDRDDLIELPHTHENVEKVMIAADILVGMLESMLGEEQVNFEEQNDY